MKALLNRIHERVGDLWWYSAMIFLACRSGDAIQAFIGLWLVPKYVGPQELGAVLPLQQLTSFLTVPLAIVAVVFSKYVNTYATRGEYGKVKSFIHDVFTCSFILFIVCIAGAYLIMPFFYERLKIASGSLTFLILLCGLFTNIGAIVGSAQQGLKRFKTMALMNFLSAPIRLVTMLVAMPFRPLSGYILGQTTPAATTLLLSAFDIHHIIKPYTPDKSWRNDLPEIWKYLWPLAIYTALSSFFGTISATVYRQRLPEIESSAYYMLTRLTDIVTFVGCTISTVLIPLASEAHEKGKENSSIIRQSILGNLIATLGFATFFAIAGRFILSLNATWKTYESYASLLPFLTVLSGICMTNTTILSYDIACRRFKAMSVILVSGALWIVALVSLTGHEYFRGVLHDSIVNAMASLHLATLRNLIFANIGIAGLQMIFLVLSSASSSHGRSREHGHQHRAEFC